MSTYHFDIKVKKIILEYRVRNIRYEIDGNAARAQIQLKLKTMKSFLEYTYKIPRRSCQHARHLKNAKKLRALRKIRRIGQDRILITVIRLRLMVGKASIKTVVSETHLCNLASVRSTETLSSAD